jgi:ribosomal-protein-serine acetyltransferase
MTMFDDLRNTATKQPNPGYQLRLLQKSDAAELFVLTDRNRSDLRRWLPWLDLINGVNDTQNFIQFTLEQAADGQGFVAAICDVDAGSIVGVIGLTRIEWQHRIGHIGYWLGKSDRGRGIMTGCCEILIEYAFTTLNLNRLVIACASENKPSRAIPTRLGFRHEGVARDAEWLYDRFVDHEIYALLLREWQSRNV